MMQEIGKFKDAEINVIPSNAGKYIGFKEISFETRIYWYF